MSVTEYAPIVTDDDVVDMAAPNINVNENENTDFNHHLEFEPLHASDAARRLISNEIYVADEEVPSFAAPAAEGGNTLLDRIRKAQQQHQQPKGSASNQVSTEFAQQGFAMEQSLESVVRSNQIPNDIQSTQPPQDVSIMEENVNQQQPFQPDTYSYATPGTNPIMPPMYSPVSRNHTTPSSTKVMDILSSVGTIAGNAATYTLRKGQKLVNTLTSSDDRQTQSLLTTNHDINVENNGNRTRATVGNPIEDVVSATNTMQPPSSETSNYNMREYFQQFLTDMMSLFMASPWFVKIAVVFLVLLFFWLLYDN
uniref:Uncharacterized protein n=1 Tax=Eucampia antarctica TaxID=49252 RepID=A0A7S2SLC1_9STRA|mmetsp:Transcript_9873/g.9557  ORF Transcript_9873/g.9557 Transcript_9873/m.9557 type:complete len:311 (+) Transcript_9873:61-993(+)|eukprot:CAMPEP_0197835506 /NCGR_PEP_ID=MMETSP1437-20131217/25958_1 /TAXON_ID=49252 ORGANISM="Eucampia antarctica, Strain CCMP1452" /NCGR_SAMPLE_ID=MMETSP1437 /ASSEMBLY_ACC=CAM_ASM_001096 /LENGTH=310 /DNA_ID=CAMNT_0043440993 /DNA_START=61 /DNA_END=993 /DNA_ORIENTATION=+